MRVFFTSIAARLTVIVIVAVVCLAAADLILQRMIVEPSFADLERAHARRHLQRCLGALKREIYHLDQYCYDSAAWDDTYEFVADGNEAYRTTNLSVDFMEDLDFSLMYIVGIDGKVVWGETRVPGQEKPMTIQEFPKGQWGRDHPLLAHAAEDSVLCGPLLTSQGIMLTASRPIITSNDEGPIRGTLVIGRMLRGTMMETLHEQTQVKMRIRPLTKDERLQQDLPALSSTEPDAEYRIKAAGARELTVEAILPDIYERPAFHIEALMPREITIKGRQATRLHALAGAGAALITLLLVLVSMRRTITTPLGRLTRHVTGIAGTGELAPNPPCARRKPASTSSCVP